MYSSIKKLINPQHDFIDCECTKTIKEHIPKILSNLTLKKANLTPNVVIRDYNVDDKQVYRVVDIDPYDLNYQVNIKCTCKNWANDAIQLGVFDSIDDVNIGIQLEKEKSEQKRYDELQKELEKEIQLEKEKKLWYKIQKQTRKGLSNVGKMVDNIIGPSCPGYYSNGGSSSSVSHSSNGWIGGCY